MFKAYDENRNIVEIQDVVNNPEKYNNFFCRTCGEPVRTDSMKSLCKRPHFKHINKCLDTWDYENKMSEWHLGWQALFPLECREAVMNNGVEIHRADICIGKTVIEFQHSPISKEDFEKRNRFYTSCGYDVVWVFDSVGKFELSKDKRFEPFGVEIANDNPMTKTIMWKKPNATFKNFNSFNNKVFVFLETKVDSVDERVLLFVNRFEDVLSRKIIIVDTKAYIKKENFLKQYGAINDGAVYSVLDMMHRIQHLYMEQLSRVNMLNQSKAYSYANVKPVIRRNRRRF